MENNIFGVTYAIRQSLIRDVYSIISCFRNIGYPLGKGFIFFLFGRGKTCGTTDERIFTIPVNLFSPGKTGESCLLPFSFTTFHIQIEGILCSVIIDNNLLLLCIPLAGGKYVGTGIFQHWDNIRQNKGLCKLVFCSAE